jgi:NAD(P)-dependent dehydrogenase (short-subunit alcohol dehydrogenase family)
MQLAGKVAVVTGGAGGIGRAICERFGREGMRVVAADLDDSALDAVVDELRAESLDVIGVAVDVTRRESVESLRDATLDAYGTVNVVCNNAGIANSAWGNVWEHENNDWRWSLEVHLFGVINGCATFVPWLLDHGDEGWIVNTVSGNGGIVPMPDSAPYALAKASIVTYTECLAAQLRAVAGSRVGVSLLFPSGYTPGLLNTGIWNEQPRPAEFARSAPRPLRRGLDAYIERMRDSGQEVRFTPIDEVADQVAMGILEDRFWMLAPSERTDGQIRARAESMIGRAQPDYMFPGR